MSPERRLALLLALLAASLVAFVASRGGVSNLGFGRPETVTDATPAAAPEPAADRGPAFPDVNLEGLTGERARPVEGGRNPFDLRSAPRQTFAAPPRPDAAATGLDPDRPQPDRPVTMAAPPIPLRFIGIVNLSRDRGRLAVLSDGDFVYHGQCGDIVEGRYRIVTIGDTSIELEYTDGRGRQSLPLAGS